MTKKLKPRINLHNAIKRNHINEISNILKNIGFRKIPDIDGKTFSYDSRTTEIDDIFCYENIILIIEYTVGDTKDHLLKKKIFYDKVMQDKRSFLEFLINEPKLKSFGEFYNEIKQKYSLNELQLCIIYCSKQNVSPEHKELNKNIIFFDYHIVKYFLGVTRVIKKSSKYEFFEFLNIPFRKVGSNIKNSSTETSEKFSGYILPEEKSSFREGYKIVSFYIDAESLLRRAFVLRQNGWRKVDSANHYQRMFAPKKLTNMRKYLVEKDRVFINNIITSIATDKIKFYDSQKNELELLDNGQFKDSTSSDVTPISIEINDECNIIGIIDGQHRIFAYHEGDDAYETRISELRKVQNLLVTGILFPNNESEEKRLIFEANLFMEINSNQANPNPQIKQEIESMIKPFSSIAIAKKILHGLNKSGPLENLIEENWYDRSKIKTASIVSYGLKPLIKLDDTRSKDSVYSIWTNTNKSKLRDNTDYDLLKEYIDFSVEQIRDILLAFKLILPQEKWTTYSSSNPDGILTVTFINSILNTLRLLIQYNKVSTTKNYTTKLKGFESFDFKKFRSSNYRNMGEEIYNTYFK